jgi:hypothetical protein
MEAAYFAILVALVLAVVGFALVAVYRLFLGPR